MLMGVRMFTWLKVLAAVDAKGRDHILYTDRWGETGRGLGLPYCVAYSFKTNLIDVSNLHRLRPKLTSWGSASLSVTELICSA